MSDQRVSWTEINNLQAELTGQLVHAGSVVWALDRGVPVDAIELSLSLIHI